MVAVVSGSGLGLFGTTGASGSPNTGRAGERVFVNTATGNLVIQGVDETLTARGLDLALVRTYNSQGLLNDDNGDNWRLGVQRRVYALSGTVNTAGSTITKVFGDSAEVVYSYDEASSRYVSTEGDGAHDTLVFASNAWTWTDESSRNSETYDSQGRLTESRDADGNLVSYIYTGARLTQIVDASGQQTFLDYTGNNLTQVRVVSDGATQTLTRYAYDAEGRLSTVTLDLSPDDNAIVDGDVYVTTYTYEDSSHRVASVTQTDGSSCAFTYQLIDGEYRVHTYTDGEGRVTTLEYSQASSTGGAQPTTVPANGGALSTTDTQTVTTDYPRNDAAVSTTDTQTDTVPHSVNSGALSTTDTQTTGTDYPLNGSALTTPALGWLGPDTRFTPASVANDPRVGFDASGNAISVWRAEHNVFAQRFDAATGTWGALSILDSLTATVSGVQLSVDGAGNALAAWIQSDGTAASLFASRYDAATGTWSAASPVENSALAVSTAAGSIVTAISGANAAISWLQTDGTRNNIYAARLSGGTWSASQLLEASDNVANQPSIAMDGSGNVAVLWQQSNGTANSVYSTRYSASTDTWSAAALLETSNTAINDPLVAFDAAGNGLAIWREAGNLFARRYTASTDTWAAQVALDNRTNTVSAPELAIDRATGNAVAAWVQSDGVANSLYTSRFTASTGTWTTAQLLETTSLAVATTASSVTASISGANIAVSWLQTDGTRNNLYVARFAAGAWTAPQLVEANDNAAAQSNLAIDGAGNVSVLWQQIADEATNLFVNRFTAATNTWSGAVLRPSPATTVNDPRIGFDAAGNAVAIWRAYSNIYSQRFNRATGLWGALSVLDSRTNTTSAPSLSVDAAGNAVAAWVQSDGTANSVYTSYLSASTGIWTAPAALLEDSPLVVPTAAGSVVTAINNGHAAVAWLQTDGVNNLYVARYDGSSWTAGDSVEANATFAAAQPSLSADAAGNVVVSWQQADTGINNSVWVNRFSVSAGAWSGPALVEVNNVAVNNPRVMLDDSGNGVGVWREGGNVYAVRYDLATNTWQPQVLIDNRTNTISLVDLAMDRATGNALAVWVQSDGVANSVYAARYTASTHAWTAPVLIESSSLAVATTAGTLVASMSGGNAAVAWLQTDGTRNNLMVARFSAGAWSAAQVVESRDTVPAQPSIAVDSNGFVSVMWQQSDGTNLGINVNRFASGGGAPYYTIQSGDTWASIATVLYGNATAASALQTAMGNPALTAGVQLTGFPPSLNVTTTTTITVPPYYLIQSGDTWASIATLLYGTAEVAGQLQTALGNPALTPGNHLTGLPAHLDTTTTTTVTVPPYYIVQASDTSFASVAALLYGNAAASAQLQSLNGNPAFAVGLRLNTLPTTISVTTTSTVTVPAYYLVQAGDDWSAITLAVYGTDDANAVAALQSQFPTVTLAGGLHLNVPATLSYVAVGSGTRTLYLRTDIEDALGFVTSLTQDATGRLTAMESPTVNGARLETDYVYDADGNVTSIVQDPHGLNRASTFEYDDRGNLTLTRDAAGNTVTRTYSATNQLLTETRYLLPDTDGAGPLVATLPITSRFVYDAEDHLRFTISAAGRVTEHRYDSFGQRTLTLQYGGGSYDLTGLAFDAPLALSALTGWAGAQDLTNLQRVDYAYDFRGNVSSTTQFAATDATGAGVGAASVSRFVYDQNGRLLSRIEARGELTPGVVDDFLTSFTYDGMGRVLNVTEWVSGTAQRTTLTSYDDASRRTAVTLESGLITTSQYNLAGELVSTTQGVMGDLDSLGTTNYTYDADGRLRMVTDPVGARVFSFYDEVGRRAAQVDADGTLTEFVYDGASALVKSVQYAVRLDTATLASLVVAGVPQDVELATLRDAADGIPNADRITRSIYDAAGRVAFTIDADGAVTQFSYDGAGRVTDEVRFANRVNFDVSVNAITIDYLTPQILSAPEDRHTRHFYDADGNEIATLDSGGYLSEFLRDPAGFLVQQIAYATRTASQYWNAGTLEELRPAQSPDDVRSHLFHDAQGRQIGVLDAEGYFSETTYDVAGHALTTTRYDVVVPYVEGTSTFTSLRAAAQADAGTVAHTTSFVYDGLGRVTRSTDFEGVVTTFGYDEVGNLARSTRAVATTEARSSEMRYDELGRVVQQLTPEGSALITTGMSQSAVDDIWSRYGVSFAYDAAGRRISATSRPNDSQTNTTLYFYDDEGRQRFEVNALGEVRETRYDAFGQASETLAYVNRIATDTLVGGAIVQALLDRVTAAADVTRDSHSLAAYTRRGELASTATSESANVSYEYDAFGDNTVRNTNIDGARSLRHEYTFDARGQLTLTTWDPAGLHTTEQRTYDAFGRTISITDPRGAIRQFEFDRLGRQLVSVDALGARSAVSYDAFSRTLTTTDALGKQTSFSYDDATRTMTMTTPEGISVVTTHNRHGQTLRVVSAGRTTQYAYDTNGNVLDSFDNLGSFGATTYDRGGRVTTTTSPSGVVTTLIYDAANRVLTKRVDSPDDLLQLLTEYQYDGEGRVTQVTEPGGRVTQTSYDRDGRVIEVVVDADELNLRTQYIYDRTGRVIETIEGAGSDNPRRVVTEFDVLGRRIRETIDPVADPDIEDVWALQLQTDYSYDAAGNLTYKNDPNGNSTWFIYDDNSRLRFTLDALGGVSESVYDAAGRVTTTRRYATPVIDPNYDPYSDPPPHEFGEIVTIPELTGLLTSTDQDRVTQSVFDGDGREVYTINGLGGVTERTYDDNGNVTRTRLFATAIASGSYASVDDVQAALTLAGNDTANVSAVDRVSSSVFDLRGRATFAINGIGAVTRSEYDASGNVISSTAYATLRDVSQPATLSALQSWAAGSAVANEADNRTTRYWYDGINRLRFTQDAAGFLTETVFDDVARTEETIGYAASPGNIAADATLDDIEALAVPLRNVAADHYSKSTRDVAGRVVRVDDAVGNHEEYEYDAVGNKTRFRNKLGNVWDYEYDANRRLISELSPEVDITTVFSELEYEPRRHYVLDAEGDTARIETRIDYDSLGNVISRTEGYGRSDARTTEYSYDALGRQVSTYYPNAPYYSGYYNEAYNYYGEFDPRYYFEYDYSRSADVYYDTLGNAISGVDKGGAITRNLFDRLGRLRYSIDAEFGVTEYRYDTFGNQTDLVRYANPVFANSDDEVELTLDTIGNYLVADAAHDRAITTEYDRVNRAIQVIEPEVSVFDPTAGTPGGNYYTAHPTTRNEYDAFGQLLKKSRLVDPTLDLWAEEFTYYDNRGMRTAAIDALGYLTTFDYDGYGNETQRVEYAKALTAGSWNTSTFGSPTITNAITSPHDPAGYDRATEQTYDSLNRRVSERLRGIEYSSALGSGVSENVADRVTTFGYDALGNQTRVTDANGAATYTYYDVLGRQIAIAAPARDLGDGTSLIPLVTMKRDAFGNMVEQRVYVNGAVSATETGYQATESYTDRVSLSLADSLNQVIQQQDPTGANSFVSYTSRGDIGREWQADGTSGGLIRDRGNVVSYEYDRLGHQILSSKALENVFSGAEGFGVEYKVQRTYYNTFGEVVERNGGDEVTNLVEYDRAGRVVRSTGADGITKVFLYNLAGQATAEIRSATRNLNTMDIAAVAALTTGRLRTETRYDLAGHVVEQRQPSFEVENPDAGLQAIGGLLRVGNNILAPNNPDAVFVVSTETIDYGDGEIHDLVNGQIDPSATLASGGGYSYSEPTAENPGGGWIQDPGYALVAGRYIHWTRPPGFAYDNGLRSLATFEIRPSSGGAYTPLRVVNLPNNELGVDIGALANGGYEYRLTYTRQNSTEPYAIATGDLTVGAVLSLADTTAATIAGENLPVTSVASEVAFNVPFRNANFRVGDFNAPAAAIDSFVYRRAVFNGVEKFVVDRLATVADGGGYYHTAGGYIQKADYLPQTGRLIQWNAPTDPDLRATFEWTPVGTTNTSSFDLDAPGAGVYSVAIGDYEDGDYEYRVTYRSISNPDAAPVATATGVVRLEPASADDSLNVTVNPPDSVGRVEPLVNRPPGSLNITSSIVASSEFEEATATGVAYTGQNDVLVSFASITGPVRVELEYMTDSVTSIEDPGLFGEGWPSEARRISLYFADASTAAAGLHLLWSDPAVEISSGGIAEILGVRVYAVDTNGDSTLQYSTNVADLVSQGGALISWKAPWTTDVQATFRVRPVGSGPWQSMTIQRIEGDFVVDLAGLAAGEWEYDVRYVQDGAERAVNSGKVTVGGASIVNVLEPPSGGVYPTEAIPPITGLYTGVLGATITSSAEHSVVGTPAPGVPLPLEWQGNNQVDLTWGDLGTSNVRVVIDYVSADRYAYNYSSTLGWEATPAYLPGTVTSRTNDFAAGATGVSFTWADSSSGLVGGISEIRRVRVYAVNGSSVALRLDYDPSAPRAGQSIYWAKADDPTVTTEFRVRATGTTTWNTLTVTDNGGGLEVVNADALAAGNYEYQVLRSRDDGAGAKVIALSTGTFAVTANFNMHNLSLTQRNVTFSGANDFGPVTWDGTNLAWTQAAGNGDTVTVRSRPVGSSTWTQAVPSGAGADYIAPVSVTGSDVVEFEILYTHFGESTAYARAGGTLNQSVATKRTAAPMVITQTNGVETTMAPVDGILAIGGQLGWTTRLFGDDIVDFRIRTGSQAWFSLPVDDLGDGYAVDLSSLPDDTYTFEITYRRPGVARAHTYGSGSFTVGGGASGSGMSLVDTTEYSRTVFTSTDASTPTRLQSFDRWGNVIAATDASGNTINYRFNQDGKLVETILPQVQVIDTTGGTVTTTLARPVQENHYDLLGRLVATRDANGNVNRAVYNVAGDLISEIAADGGVKSSVYDAFGDVVLTTDQLGYRTHNAYDGMGRLTSVEREVVHGGLGSGNSAQALTESYDYDWLGQRISETNGAGETIHYRYHMDGNLRSRETNRGFTTYYLYDQAGRKVSEEDANHKTQTWTYDYLGRLAFSTDIGGNRTEYRYDGLNHVVYQTSSLGQRQRFEYDEAGQLTRIVDTGSPSRTLADVVGVNRITEYGYDIEGRRVGERTVINGRVHQDTFTTFDALGRISRVNDPDYEVSYSYDGVGNRTRINADYFNHIGKGTGYVQTQDLWYTYDEMNRVLTSQGLNFAGVVSITNGQGIDLTYNLKGERTSARTSAEHYSLSMTTLNGFVTSVTYHRLKTGLFTERYTYDGIGRLLATDQDMATTTHNLNTGAITSGTTSLNTSSRQFDAASREIYSTSRSMDPEEDNDASLDISTTSTTYDADGRTAQQITRLNGIMTTRVTFGDATFQEAGFVSITSTTLRTYMFARSARSGTSSRSSAVRAVSFNTSHYAPPTQRYMPDRWDGPGWDAAGNLIGYRVEFFKESNGKFKYFTDHKFEYRFGQGYQMIHEGAHSEGRHDPEDGSTNRTYNVNGELVQFTDNKAQKNNRYFANDSQGQALTVVNGKFDGRSGHLSVDRAFANALTRTGNKVKAQYFFFANGQNIGTFGQLIDSEGSIKANFDVNYTPVSSGYPSTVPSEVIVQSGDTLRSIAARVFGDPSLWYVLAEANGLTDPDAKLEPGLQLEVPNKVLSLQNNSESFKPFDASLAVGDTTPTQPPAAGGCGIIGMIILIVVAIVATILTAGAAAVALGAASGSIFAAGVAVTTSLSFGIAGFAAAVIGGALGSAISQGVAIAAGIQDKFDWKGVAIGAISAGVTAGLGGLGEAAGAASKLAATGQKLTTAQRVLVGFGKIIANPAGKAAVSSILTQGVSVATGVQSSFSWREVAASAVSAEVSASAGRLLGGASPGKIRAFGSNVIAGAAGSVAGTVVRGGKVDVSLALRDAFANVVANSIVDEMKSAFNPPGTVVKRGPGLFSKTRQEVSQGYVPRAPEIAMVDPASLTKDIDFSELLKTPDLKIDETYTAKRGDSISKIMGTSDPAAIGAFMRANGLMSSDIRAGEEYIIPADITASDAKLGQGALNNDNAMRALIAEERAAQQAQASAREAAAVSGSFGSGDFYQSPVMRINGAPFELPYETEKFSWLENADRLHEGLEVVEAMEKMGGNLGTTTTTTTTLFERSDALLTDDALILREEKLATQTTTTKGTSSILGVKESTAATFETRTTPNGTKVTQASGSTTSPLLSEESKVGKAAKWLGAFGDVLEWGMGGYESYKEEGRVDSRLIATMLVDGGEIVGSGFVSGVAGTATGTVTTAGVAATGVGAPVAPVAGWAVGTATTLYVDDKIDTWWKQSDARQAMITGVTISIDVGDATIRYLNHKGEEFYEWISKLGD